MSEDVELSHVNMDFGKFRAVNNVDVTIKAGEFFSFLGPSGCGKTTILRLISGFMDPTGGAVRIGGKDMIGIVYLLATLFADILYALLNPRVRLGGGE